MFKQYQVDIEGTDVMSSLIVNLVNQFPGLKQREEIKFATLGKDKGIAFYPTSGAAILNETETIIGEVKQVCSYPFIIIYKSSPRTELERLKIKEFLDALGKWLERQPIKVNNKTYVLQEYPKTGSTRKIESVELVQPAFLAGVDTNNVEHWEISCRVNYRNEFFK